ncbi:hypothetical protein Acsp02_51970 [Actinoplanes sp. NBRC 103695]|nr:hypothetical protein Acsp02_51970 [Actinoplanes sp. NBRC 103695]
MGAVRTPDLSRYLPHRVAEAEFEGETVPGLTAEFYRRPEGERIATVGRYLVGGRELFRAWGYADEEHCRHSAVSGHPPVDGCPVVELERDPGGSVVGLRVRTPGGEWAGTRHLE